MTELELKLQKLQWRVGIFETVFARTFGGVLAQLGVSYPKLSEILVTSVDAIQQLGEPMLLQELMLEDREQLTTAFRQVCEEMKQDFENLLSEAPKEKSQEEK